ncbi:hypothetical protein DSM104443_00539 [Usitatibacter rugosus]|uniref:Polyketide cyclase/dehydrase/lipid transport protein n=1 Tax=Usitatibacter rugosus TaxID=2732067 RepID=A0A6M4GR08_9PROT|nr:SRPBCC family protein [Usitatibacter rugosus]QJR09495.1 hypothetical protein DSM104443_00539 [Usitatibacter rugosus]
MAYCPNCAREIAPDAFKCPGCGADFKERDQWRPVLMKPETAKPLNIAGGLMMIGVYLLVLGLGAIYGVAAYKTFADVFSIREASASGLMLVSFLVGVPLAIGVLVGFIARRRTNAGVAGTGALSTLSIALFVFTAGAVLREGSICIVMAAPLFFVAGIIGAIVGSFISPPKRRGSKLVPAVLLIPLVGGPLEAQFPSPTEHQVITRSVHIAAQPESVWQHINYPLDIQPSELSEGFAYRIGVPYPIEARTIEGRVGGTRTLKWERGVTFEETITAWEPKRRVAWVYKFGPDSFPPGSLDDHIVIGGKYFDLEETSYTLTPEAGGTRLTIKVGTRITTNFNWYAGLWADYLVSDTAEAILKFYKTRSEKPARG